MTSNTHTHTHKVTYHQFLKGTNKCNSFRLDHQGYRAEANELGDPIEKFNTQNKIKSYSKCMCQEPQGP